MRPVAANLSCDIYLPVKRSQAATPGNISHYEHMGPSGFPSQASFASAPLLVDGNIATGYPIIGPGSNLTPSCYVLYSFPSDQAITKIDYKWSSITSCNGLICRYYHSEDGVHWESPSSKPGAAKGVNGTITYKVKCAAKYHLILMSYADSPITLVMAEAHVHDGATDL